MFDTHSGSGLYDLFDNRIVKTGEAENGIQGLLGVIARGGSEGGPAALEETSNRPSGGLYNCNDLPESFHFYLNLIREYTSRNLYPGSPEIERRLLRHQDTLILSELHPQEIQNLRNNMKKPVINSDDARGCPNIKIHNRNGWEMIKALTPPVTKRGAVLIDPSYEESQDYIDAASTICEVHKKWSNGIIMLWYPLLAHRESEINAMTDNIISSAKNINQNTEISNLQLEVYSKDNENLPRLYGSGMLVINSPWKLEEECGEVIKYLEKTISTLYE